MHKEGFSCLQEEGSAAINKEKQLKLFREGNGVLSERYKVSRLLLLDGFSLLAMGGGGFNGVHFCTIIGNVLHKVKILEKVGLVQFEKGNHGSLLMSNLLLKEIVRGWKKAWELCSKANSDFW